ncbi:MAG TPA: hypothetical protein VGV89_00405 [Thermoplasmata archaeon]|nr:hypothetical protein [Thermoplasmata archaeon]
MRWALLGCVTAFAGLFAYVELIVLGPWRGWVPDPGQELVLSFATLVVVLGVNLLIYLPRFVPVLPRIGISPAGLTLPLPFPSGPRSFAWVQLRWIDSHRIEVNSLRFALTPSQAGSIRKFVHAPG